MCFYKLVSLKEFFYFLYLSILCLYLINDSSEMKGNEERERCGMIMQQKTKKLLEQYKGIS